MLPLVKGLYLIVFNDTAIHISAADSKHAITGSLDGKLIIWDMHSGGKSQVNNYSESLALVYMVIDHHHS